MRVSAQYAESHLPELLAAADKGEQVEIDRAGQPAFRLIVCAAPATVTRSLLNSARKQIWFAEDWNSSETNKGIASLFEESALLPDSIPATTSD